jgi:dGTPase
MNDSRWFQLLKPTSFRQRSQLSKHDGRDPFENDYARLISSAPIRRLQDKTQVYPLEQSDFVRTRLTHSLEVSSLARSLGKSIEAHLIKKGQFPKKLFGQISSLLATAGLVHDLGNPPFGHFGEVAIKDFFTKYFQDQKPGLTEAEKQDFKNFDGNVQTLRILRKLYYLYDEHGYNLTYPTLSVIIKYPCSSTEGNKGSSSPHISLKKFGYFQSEREDYMRINEDLGLEGKRHPLTYLLEAADDIAYMSADVEDGVKLGIVSVDTFIEELSSLQNQEPLNIFKKDYDSLKNRDVDRLDITIQRFRINIQRILIDSVIEVFCDNYKSIMDGTFKTDLLSASKSAEIQEMFGRIMKVILRNKRIIGM